MLIIVVGVGVVIVVLSGVLVKCMKVELGLEFCISVICVVVE